MIILLIILLLIISFLLHMYALVQYIQKRKRRYLTYFLNTTISNIILALGLIFFSLYDPNLISRINVKLLFWMVSGLILVLMLIVQIIIFRQMYLRAQEPEHYHLNFFGKKVLHSSVVKPTYIMGFFVSMPFLLFAGAYFVARLINLILYGQL